MSLALLATLPPLPPTLESVPGWVDEGQLQMSWAGEGLFFVVIAWGAGAAGTFALRGTGWSVSTVIALVALGVTLLAFVIALLALGRLVIRSSTSTLRQTWSSSSRVRSSGPYTWHSSHSRSSF
ncbi:hypothetical protein GIS00_26630 [Nakamurella sp. YIM 132087]|uniref:Uncharacterized protein n=1 Tax=Nakamurella alba TaxID=2665158 RepID=A0A7K1FVX9_9ACTN|nr:hypothetical protein [Nakamurella alba]MTD17509.1 hypothetical protein [Nakamurella alba]